MLHRHTRVSRTRGVYTPPPAPPRASSWKRLSPRDPACRQCSSACHTTCPLTPIFCLTDATQQMAAVHGRGRRLGPRRGRWARAAARVVTFFVQDAAQGKETSDSSAVWSVEHSTTGGGPSIGPGAGIRRAPGRYGHLRVRKRRSRGSAGLWGWRRARKVSGRHAWAWAGAWAAEGGREREKEAEGASVRRGGRYPSFFRFRTSPVGLPHCKPPAGRLARRSLPLSSQRGASGGGPADVDGAPEVHVSSTENHNRRRTQRAYSCTYSVFPHRPSARVERAFTLLHGRCAAVAWVEPRF